MAKAQKRGADKTKMQVVEIPAMRTETILVAVVGDSPLISNQWSEKAKREMRDKQQGKAKKGRSPKNPNECYEASLYKHPEGGYGFPAIAFKAAAVRAAKAVGMAMTDARGAFHINCDLVKIKGKPHMREDMVRNTTGVADIRYRAEFPTWSTTFPVQYDTAVISAEQLINLFNRAGFAPGVGDWRCEKNGDKGRFHVKLGK